MCLLDSAVIVELREIWSRNDELSQCGAQITLTIVTGSGEPNLLRVAAGSEISAAPQIDKMSRHRGFQVAHGLPRPTTEHFRHSLARLLIDSRVCHLGTADLLAPRMHLRAMKASHEKSLSEYLGQLRADDCQALLVLRVGNVRPMTQHQVARTASRASQSEHRRSVGMPANDRARSPAWG
jgi:hypothetical protein